MICHTHGRTILWPRAQARFLQLLGVSATAFNSSQLAAIRRAPHRYVVQLTMRSIPDLLDLPVGPACVFVHANGEPFGPYDPDWQVLLDWLRYTDTPFYPIGTSGHASPRAIHRLVGVVRPDIVFPIHSEAPARLIPPSETVRWLPERGGRRFPLRK